MAESRSFVQWQDELEALQDQVLADLDQLNQRIELTLAELLPQRAATEDFAGELPAHLPS